MKKIILLVIFAVIICFIVGCGPGQPFEIEEHNQASIRLVYAR